MLKDAKQIVPVLPVTDLERSRKFYSETLGLKEIRSNASDGGADYGVRDGPALHIFPKPGAKGSDTTMAMLIVDDVDGTVRDLKTRGVRFEQFDMPGVTWSGDIAKIGNEQAAWFKDPDGHWLAIGTE